jgi:hypothetical protein
MDDHQFEQKVFEGKVRLGNEIIFAVKAFQPFFGCCFPKTVIKLID